MSRDDFDPEYMPDDGPEVLLARCRICGRHKYDLTTDDLCSSCHEATYNQHLRTTPPPPRKDPTR